MGFSVQMAPSVRVRVLSSGVRTSVGSGAIRVHIGGGAPAFSSGAGPVTYSTSPRILNDVSTEQLKQVGAANTLTLLALDNEPELRGLLDVIDFDELGA